MASHPGRKCIESEWNLPRGVVRRSRKAELPANDDAVDLDLDLVFRARRGSNSGSVGGDGMRGRLWV